jgi:DNA gyrase subunit B
MAKEKGKKEAPKTNLKSPDKKPSSYGAGDIFVLEGLDPVRKRPGMYIGSTGPEGLHHLIWEIFDNGRDEAMGGFADEVEVALLPNNRVRVADNGRGIPVDIHKQTKVSALETVMTTLHAGGKFGGDSYKISGGLHGVGVSVVNALSSWTRAEIHREGGKHEQEYKKGQAVSKVKKIANSKLKGTIISFEPDTEIFGDKIEFDIRKIINQLRQQAYLVKKLKVRIIDARDYEGKIEDPTKSKIESLFLHSLKLPVPSQTFYFEGGLLSLVKHLNKDETPVGNKIFYTEKASSDGETVEVALQYIDEITTKEISFANNIITPEGGMHLTGFRTALTRTINDYARKNNLIKDGEDNFTGEDVREGMVAVISIALKEPQFEGQTKAKLGSPEARGVVETVFGEAFSVFLEESPNEGRAIVNKVLLALKARKAARAAKESVLRKGALEGLTLPGKLADCQSRKAEESEIFIVEGDSAGGSSKQGRDRRTQAILPLRGKILNVERARIDKMLANKEIKSLVIALGTAISDEFNLEKLRYHKIIIATDADVDGAHISTLLLTLFYRYFKPIVEGGYLYLALPPLFRIQKGKEIQYAYSEEEKNKILGKEEVFEEDEGSDEENNGEEKKEKPKRGYSVQRYKGLGEMNPGQLWETTMDPSRRLLKQITVEDAEEADKTFDILMGKEVAPRKLFIQTHAKAVKNLDV